MVVHILTHYDIRLATIADVPHLEAVERSAAHAFLSLPDYIESGRTVPQEILESMTSHGQLWVSVHANGEMTGFVGCRDVGQLLYVHEISVALPHQKKGLGRKLMQAVMDYAVHRHYPAIGLTTRRDARWNKPFYQSMGFAETVDAGEYPELQAIVAKEIREGVDPAIRCAMIKRLPKAMVV